MKTKFPNTPILGLTATATPAVITDIQKILNIGNCTVFKDSFFRPNLKYFIEKLPKSKDNRIERMATLLQTKYLNQSGIIYCMFVKDVELVVTKLSNYGLKALPYHAQLNNKIRTQNHNSWHQNKCQIIVATVAFGMGINKPDVRFIIHYSLTKSLEAYYQETGRAGRDGQPADCILFYGFSDVFRAITLVYGSKNGLKHVFQMLGFMLNEKVCRKGILSLNIIIYHLITKLYLFLEQIAIYFGDKKKNMCRKMCDNCDSSRQLIEIDVTEHLLTIMEIIKIGAKHDEKMTAKKLIDAWTGIGQNKNRYLSISAPDFGRNDCEHIIGLMISDGYLKVNVYETKFAKVCYFTVGQQLRPNSRVKYFLNISQNTNRSRTYSELNIQYMDEPSEPSTSYKGTTNPWNVKNPMRYQSKKSPYFQKRNSKNSKPASSYGFKTDSFMSAPTRKVKPKKAQL